MKQKYVMLLCIIVIIIAGLFMVFTVRKSFDDFNEYTEPNTPDGGWEEDIETSTVIIDGVEYNVNINN